MRFFRWVSMSFMFVVLLLVAVPAYGSWDHIRVLLKQEYSSASFEVVEGDYELVDSGTGLRLAKPLPGERWLVYRAGSVLKLQREGEAGSISVSGGVLLQAAQPGQGLFQFESKRYRGSLHLVEANQALLVVNILPVEEYLYGVLPQEMPSSFPLEALKAQAVVSRTYALCRKGSSLYYDVTAGMRDQVYGGYEAELVPGAERIRQAVDETRGLKIYYDGALVEAVFHANAGGYTADSEKVWGGNRPYLKPVPSPYDAYALEFSQQYQADWPVNTYQWVKTFTAAELERQLAQWNSLNPAEAIHVGQVLSLIPYGEPVPGDASGLLRVYRLDIVGTKGTVSISGEKSRSVFGLNSSLYAVDFGAALYVSNGVEVQSLAEATGTLAVVGREGVAYIARQGTWHVKGAGATRQVNPGGNEITFQGRGFGHGVGMSQWGAAGMAAAGYNFQEIIEHYYNQGKFDGRLTISE